MEYHLRDNDLMGVSTEIKEDKIMLNAFQIDVVDDNCLVAINVVNRRGIVRRVYRRGKHCDMLFKTSIDNLPLTINLKTGVIKRTRNLNE